MSIIHWKCDMMRVEMWKIAWTAFKHHPIMGSGPDTYFLDFRRFETPSYVKITHDVGLAGGSAHNDIMQVLSTLGIVGLIAYLLLIYRMSVVALKSKSRSLIAAFVAIFTQAKFDPIPLSLMILVAVLIGCADPILNVKTWHKAIAMVCCLFVCGVSLQVCRAEHERMTAYLANQKQDFPNAFNHYNQAVARWPFEWTYVRDQLYMLWIAVYNTHDKNMALVMASISEKAANIHPNDPDVLEWEGVSWANVSAFGGGNHLAESKSDWERAAQLAPLWPTNQQRLVTVK